MTTRSPSARIPVYLLAAPIGDYIGDMSLAATQLVGQVALLLVEDTGVENRNDLAERLRRHGVIKPNQQVLGIRTTDAAPPWLEPVERMVSQGQPFAILADKGLCCFLDPGLEVVQYLLAHHAERVELVPIGASSALDAAIMVSGVDCSRFMFMGHFPEYHAWPERPARKGIPAIAYVRGDSLGMFWVQARHRLRADRDMQMTVLRNLRARLRRAWTRFDVADATPEAEARIEALMQGPEVADGTFLHDFVVVLHRPWAAPERRAG